MLLKYTLKNIFSKPGRLIVLMLCLTVACLAGFVALDFGGSVKDAINTAYMKYGGDYIIIDWGENGVTDETFEGTELSKVTYIGRKQLTKREETRKQKLYSYVLTDEISIMGFSSHETALSMELIKTDYLPGKGEIAISREYSDKYGYNIGDPITVYDSNGEPVPLTVSYIYEKEPYLGDLSGYISEEEAVILTNSSIYVGAVVDVPDDYRDEFESIMEQRHPNVLVTPIYLSETLLESINNVTYVLYLIFVLVFVLVIFVTVSFTEKIITERMSVIGTLRSIGMSMRKTTAILLFENVIYGLLGSGIAFILYVILRDQILGMLAVQVGAYSILGRINLLSCLIIVLFAVALQVIVPMAEVVKAVKTSIRDIIFDSRDGEYRVSYAKTITGFVFIAAGLICGFLIRNLAVSIAAVLIIIMGSGLCIQFIVRKVTYALSKVFGSAKMPAAELAAVETGSKKPDSSNAVLAVAAVTTAATVFLIGVSLMATIERPDFDADIIITGASGKTSRYEYITEFENVSDVEYVYEMFDDISVGGKEVLINVLALPDYKHYKRFGELPASLGENECAVDPTAANKFDIHDGDTVEFTFISSGVFPAKKTMRVRVLEYSQFMGLGTIIVPHQLFKELYTDNVTTIFVTSNDPVNVKTELEDSFSKGEKVQTMDERLKDIEEDTGKIRLIVIGIVAAAVSLTLIGISGNQIIGFASRKKEYAILHSCACTRNSIIKMILAENAMLFGVSCIVSAIMCIPVTLLVARIFILTDTGIIVSVRYDTLFLCIFALWFITMLTSLSPIRSLRKMNTAMEMKYE